MSRGETLRYLRTAPGGWWRWEDEGGVIVWIDGTTLAFRAEVKALLDLLAPAGLPPFAEVVLVLALLRGKEPGLASVPLGGVAPEVRGQLVLALDQRRQSQTRAGLGVLRRLPAELTTLARHKAMLLEAVLERGHKLPIDVSLAIAAACADPFPTAELNGAPAQVLTDNDYALARVADGLRRYTADTLALRIRTGVETAPAPVPELVLPVEQQAQRLLAALAAEADWGGLVQVTRDLMAALRLPQVLADPDTLALGGAADLTNRGTLDRLLLSELAHDDLVLATRVALNEALYLRREPPAHRPRRSLGLLLDAGLRMWGVPRVLALAAALALLGRREGYAGARVWRAAGREVVPEDWASRAGIESHLAALATELHPGAAVPRWTAALAALGEVDAVVITHRDALADAGLQARLAEAGLARGFLVVVERDGLVQLHPLPWGAPRPLAEVRVDVARLLPRDQAKPAPAPLLDEREAGEWPAALRAAVFPLLLPVTGKLDRTARLVEGGLALTADRQLWHWSSRKHGARLLAADLPGGATAALETGEEGRVLVVKGRGGDGQASVTMIPLAGGAARVTRFTGPPMIKGVHLDGGVLLLVLHTRVAAVEVGTGALLAETPYPAGLAHAQGRYFRQGEAVQFVTWDGGVVRWVACELPGRIAPREALVVFDHERCGPWVLTRDGRLVTPDGRETFRLGFSIEGWHAERVEDGFALRRVRAEKGKAADDFHLLEVSLPRCRALHVAQLRHYVGGTALPVPSRNLQCHFNAIAATPRRGLRLRTRKGKWLELFMTPQCGLKLVDAAAGSRAEEDVRLFEEIVAPRRFGCTLKLARWPGGSRAWLDSRGLLHVRSHDETVPEVTLALNFGAELAGWTSAGAVCGGEFFLGRAERVDARQVRDAIERFWNLAC